MTETEKQIAALLEAADSTSPIIRAAFISVVQEIRGNLFDTTEMEIALANHDIEGAIRASGIDRMNDLMFGIGMDNNAYVFNRQLNDIFVLGASVAISNLAPDLQKAISFDTLSERAVSFLRQDNLNSITDLTNSSRTGVRVAIERSLAEGMNPARQAQDIRSLIGLTDPQIDAVANFRLQLRTQQQQGFTPAGERRLSAVDQAIVNRHMKEGHLSDAQIQDMVDKYYNSLLNKRALDISHTEALNAINNGQQEAWSQGLDQGVFSDNEHRKFWIVTRDDRLRKTHSVIPGMNPGGVKIKSQFVTPHGLVDNPGTRNAGFINCRCCVVLGMVGQQYHQDGYLI